MNRDLFSFGQRDNNNDDDLTNKFKLSIIFLCVLAALRIFNLDILWTLSDLISAAVVYFTYTSKSGLMAIFCLVNGIIGIIYSIIKGVSDYSAASKAGGIKYFFVVTVIFLALFVYSFLTYYSYKAFKEYKRDFGGQEQNNAPSSTYGSTNQDVQGNFKAFSGKGYTFA